MRGGGRHFLPYFEYQEKVPWFCKRCPDCVHLWVKFFSKNVALRICRRENSQIFPWGAFFLVFLTKCLYKCPNLKRSPLSWKISVCVSGLRNYLLRLSRFVIPPENPTASHLKNLNFSSNRVKMKMLSIKNLIRVISLFRLIRLFTLVEWKFFS